MLFKKVCKGAPPYPSPSPPPPSDLQREEDTQQDDTEDPNVFQEGMQRRTSLRTPLPHPPSSDPQREENTQQDDAMLARRLALGLRARR